MRSLVIKPGEVTLAMLRTVSKHPIPISLDPAAYRKIDASKRLVDNLIADGQPPPGRIDDVFQFTLCHLRRYMRGLLRWINWHLLRKTAARLHLKGWLEIGSVKW
jgi:hypothetical protein